MWRGVNKVAKSANSRESCERKSISQWSMRKKIPAHESELDKKSMWRTIESFPVVIFSRRFQNRSIPFESQTTVIPTVKSSPNLNSWNVDVNPSQSQSCLQFCCKSFASMQSQARTPEINLKPEWNHPNYDPKLDEIAKLKTVDITRSRN